MANVTKCEVHAFDSQGGRGQPLFTICYVNCMDIMLCKTVGTTILKEERIQVTSFRVFKCFSESCFGTY